MERRRLVTGFLLAPIAFLIAFWASISWIALIYAIFITLGAFEWAGFARASIYERAGFMIAVAGVILILWLYRPAGWMTLTEVAAFGWVLAPILIIWRRAPLARPWVFLAGFLALVPAWCALVALVEPSGHENDLLLAFLLLVWGVDSGAYLIGRLYGRHPLAPRVSPNKTWEGVWGGVLAVGIAILVMRSFFGISFAAGLLMGTAVWIFAIIGDLLESCFKRWSGMKDSGRLFPGHGGVLDRIDSWIAAAPVFLLCSRWLLRWA
ncbi:phosphatidate cytidylyltransferase [mine drainage metagenome]|uniref:Phosphatidate cytidylyltransferase n=1 Tax=mine drainage metagenome TaxID=410659 RepID=T0YMF3_9ZZZZ